MSGAKCDPLPNRKRKWDPERGRGYKEKLRARNREWAYQYLLAHPCEECGEEDPVVLEFDHVRGAKSSGVAQLLNHASLERIQREVELCRVLCANCHRKRSAIQLGWSIAQRHYGLDPKPEIE